MIAGAGADFIFILFGRGGDDAGRGRIDIIGFPGQETEKFVEAAPRGIELRVRSQMPFAKGSGAIAKRAQAVGQRLLVDRQASALIAFIIDIIGETKTLDRKSVV